LSLFESIIIAFGVAMDAFAVSIASGTARTETDLRDDFRIASFLAGFQAAMPVLGWLGGLGLGLLIKGVDHWIAFALLGAIGARMIYESATGKRSHANTLSTRTLIGLSFATSIDALIVGVTLPLMDISAPLTVFAIGAITFTLCTGGLHLGRRFGGILGDVADLIGGAILIAIGTRILLIHLGA